MDDDDEFSLGPAEEEAAVSAAEAPAEGGKLLFEPKANKVRISIDRFYELMVEDWRNSKSVSYDIYLQQGNIPSGTLYKTMGVEPFHSLTDEDLARIENWKSAWIQEADKFQRTDLAKREDIVEAVGCLAANFLNKKRNAVFNEVIKKATWSHLATIIADKCADGIVELHEMTAILKAARDFGLLTDELHTDTLAAIKEQIANHNAHIQSMEDAFSAYYAAYTAQNPVNDIDNEKNRRMLYEKFVELRILDNQISDSTSIIPEQEFRREFSPFMEKCNIRLKPAIELFKKQYFAKFAAEHDLGKPLSQEDYSILKAVATTTYGIAAQAWEDFKVQNNIRDDSASRSSTIEAKLNEIDDLKQEIERLKKQGLQDQREIAEELMRKEAQHYAQQRLEQERQERLEAERLAEARRLESERAAAAAAPQPSQEEQLAELKRQEAEREAQARWQQAEMGSTQNNSGKGLGTKKQGLLGKLLLIIIGGLLWLIAILAAPPQLSTKVSLIAGFVISFMATLLFRRKTQKFFTIILPILLFAFFKAGYPALKQKFVSGKSGKTVSEANSVEGTYFCNGTQLVWKKNGIEWGGVVLPVSLNEADRAGVIMAAGEESLAFHYYNTGIIFDPPLSEAFVKKNVRFSTAEAAAVAGKTYVAAENTDDFKILLSKTGKMNTAKDEFSYAADAKGKVLFYWNEKETVTGALFYTDGGTVLRKRADDENAKAYDIFIDTDNPISTGNSSSVIGKSYGGKWSDKFTVTVTFGKDGKARLAFSDGDAASGTYLVSKDGLTLLYNHRETGKWFAFTTDAKGSSVKFYKTLEDTFVWEKK